MSKTNLSGGVVVTLVALAMSSPAHAAVKPVWETRTDVKTGLVRQLSGGLTVPMGATPEEAARRFLEGNVEVLSRRRVKDELVVTSTSRSPLGHHVHFMHRAGGLPVLGVGVTVHMDDQMRVKMVTARPRAATLPIAHDPSIPADTALHAAKTDIGVTGDLRGDARAELALLPEDGGDRLVYRVAIPARKPFGDWEVIVDAKSGSVVSKRNLAQRAHGKVFDPNPCVTLKNAHLSDSDDSADAVPAEAYKTVELLGLDGSGTLKGQFVDVSGSRGGPAKEDSGEFNYTRNDPKFEQVNVYYHLDRVQRYIQSLGFTNVNNRQISADVHGIEDDNSFYSPMTKSLTFGNGGVDDAEDADVVCHEYGHSIQDNQVPGFGGSSEGGAMGEGFGDYLAGSVRSDQGFNPLALAIWDATAYSQADPPALRRLDSTKHYPENIQGEVHADGEIWSATLRQIWDKLGAQATDKLVLQSHFFLEPDAKFAEGAEAILRADREMNQGANQATIRAIFEARGILKPATSNPPSQPNPPAQPTPPQPPAQPQPGGQAAAK